MIRFVADEQGAVLIIVNGKIADRMGSATAKTVARALASVAQVAENRANPEQTIRDQATLMRAGVPVALTTDAKLIDKARTESQWNRDLRRYMPKIKSAESVRAPTVKVKK